MQVCKKKKAASNIEWVMFFKAKRLCFVCLAKGHMSVKCHRRMTCEICQQKHLTVQHHTEKRMPDPTDAEKENHNEATLSSALVSLGNHLPTGAGIMFTGWWTCSSKYVNGKQHCFDICIPGPW